MSDHYTLLNGASVAGGDYVDMESITYGAAPTTRKRTRTVITGTAAAAIADVVNSTPSASAYGLPVRLAGPVVINSDPGQSAYGLPVRIVGLQTDATQESAYAIPIMRHTQEYHDDVASTEAPDWRVGSIAYAGGFTLGAQVAAGDNVQFRTDRWGRLLTAHIDPTSYTWKANTYTSAQTGATVLSGASATTSIAIIYAEVTCSGTTAGRFTLWFGTTADTTYTEGTDQALMDVELIPSATRSETYILAPSTPIYSLVNRDLKITTSAAINPIRLVVYGYLVEQA